MYLMIAGLLLICVRVAWQVLDPIGPAGFKGLLYIRDYAILLPAVLCWYVAIIRAKPQSSVDNALSRAEEGVSWLRDRPLLVLTGSCVAIVLGCMMINVLVFKTLAHISDEYAYLFQAEIFSSGRLWANPAPGSARFFGAGGIVCGPDKWYGGAPPGQSIALAIGVLLKAPFIVNPILCGALLALTVWAGRRLFSAETGLLAGVLMLTSPFVLLQGSSYFCHVLSAVCLLPAVVLILTSSPSNKGKLALAGLFIGALLLCRPYSAVLLGSFVIVFWMWQIFSSKLSLTNAIKGAVLVFLGFVPSALLFLAYNWVLTGSLFRTPLQVAWGPQSTLEAIRIGPHIFTTGAINMVALSVMMLGVPLFSLAAPVACFWSRERKWLGPITVLLFIYIFGYSCYRFHGVSYGPRYYFELMPLLLLMCACGLRALPDLLSRWFALLPERSRRSVVGICIAGAAISVLGVLPMRLWIYHQRAEYLDIRNLVERNVQSPAIVFITNGKEDSLAPRLAGYQLNDVDLEGPVIFARDRRGSNPQLIAARPGRHAYLLDVDTRRIELYTPNDPE